ncbi:hypothetical protein BJV74DRAFT_829949 [Russula compacta]|nr:hypothetical protein BJV74DRAFT_829949 [Russula compacta]
MSHPRPASFKLDVIIVGGSIAGLSMAIGLAMSGHTVRVLEKSPNLGDSPGGIRLSPNVTKILMQWGLEDEVRKRGSFALGETRIWDFETGELVGSMVWEENILQESGAKIYMLRYSDLREMLYTAAVRAGSEVTFNANVSLVVPPSSSVTPDSSSSASSSYRKPSVHLSDGTILEADMIIGADGQHSTVRLSVQGRPIKPKVLGTVAFTGNVPTRKVLEDDILKTENVAYSYMYWLGPRRCFFSYPISHNTELSVHLYWDHDEPDVPEGWTPNLLVESLKLNETTSDHKLGRLIEKIDSFCWQRFLEWPEIENWSDESSRIVLIGEASRPLLPCDTQSSSICIEGAAVLSTLLSYVRGLDHIPALVRAYETVRRERTELLRQIQVTNITQLMLPPGLERAARDDALKQLLHAGQSRWNTDSYLRIYKQLCEVWAYNAFDAADDWWAKWGVLRERALSLQNPDVEIPFPPLEVNVIAETE